MGRLLVAAAVAASLCMIAVFAAPQPRQLSSSSVASGQNQNRDQTSRQTDPPPEIQIFLGTITKAGDRFVFSDDINKGAYELDDQATASRFADEKVRVTGTLDAANSLIRVQSIAAADARSSGHD
jgi:uncharacterized protein YdeI (BOF family)